MARQCAYCHEIGHKQNICPKAKADGAKPCGACHRFKGHTPGCPRQKGPTPKPTPSPGRGASNSQVPVGSTLTSRIAALKADVARGQAAEQELAAVRKALA
jgi:hypothetical protein